MKVRTGHVIGLFARYFAIGAAMFAASDALAADAENGKRLAQAQRVAGHLASVLRAAPNTHIAVLGDLNSDLGDEPIAALAALGLEPLLVRVPAEQRYTYVFAGQPHALDHVLVSPALARRLRERQLGD